MKKTIMILLALATLSIVLVPSIRAQGVEAWVSLNKSPYEPGEQGTISILIRNNSNDPIEVRNLTIVFNDWMAYTEDGWDKLGNQTIKYSPAIIVSSNSSEALDDISFTVPNDARGHSTSVDLTIYTNKGVIPGYAIMGWNDRIEVLDAYSLRYLRAIDNIAMLLTVVALLAIIGAIIVAAAIFLSGRKPGVSWQKEG